MSHFVAMVVGSNIEEQLEKYSEHIEVEEYVVEEVSEDDKESMLGYYKREKNESFDSFDECYERYGDDWNYNRWRKDEDGIWREYSTYNPDSKWDWYEVGGRWAGLLELKKGVDRIASPNFSWGFTKEEKEACPSNRVDIAYKKDIANWESEDIIPFALVIDGKWYERGNMGLWGIVSNDTGSEWNKTFAELTANISDDELITMVDCHI